MNKLFVPDKFWEFVYYYLCFSCCLCGGSSSKYLCDVIYVHLCQSRISLDLGFGVHLWACAGCSSMNCNFGWFELCSLFLTRSFPNIWGSTSLTWVFLFLHYLSGETRCLCKEGVGNLRPACGPRTILMQPAGPPRGGKIIRMNIMCTLARVACAARHKKSQFFFSPWW